MENLTQEYILQLGRSHAQIAQAIDYWRRGDITWEQATYMMIIEITRSKVDISDKYLELLNQKPFPTIIMSNSDTERMIALPCP